jgi:hypothetical protein
LLLSQLANLALWCSQDCDPIKRENNDSECVPSSNCCTREPKVASQCKEYRRTGGESQDQALARIRTADNIDNAHLCTRITNISPAVASCYWGEVCAAHQLPSSGLALLNGEADVAPAAPVVMRSALRIAAASFFSCAYVFVTNSGNAAFIWTSCDTSNPPSRRRGQNWRNSQSMC